MKPPPSFHLFTTTIQNILHKISYKTLCSHLKASKGRFALSRLCSKNCKRTYSKKKRIKLFHEKLLKECNSHIVRENLIKQFILIADYSAWKKYNFIFQMSTTSTKKSFKHIKDNRYCTI